MIKNLLKALILICIKVLKFHYLAVLISMLLTAQSLTIKAGYLGFELNFTILITSIFIYHLK